MVLSLLSSFPSYYMDANTVSIMNLFVQKFLQEEDKEAVLRRLEEAVEAQPDDDSLRFNLAVFLWENCDNDDGESARKTKEKAAEHFVASAKFNPQNGAAFRYLGHHYSQVFHDSQRAMRCYQRAVSLNPDDSHSGEALCDLLDVAGKETLEIAVCREASEKSPRASWAFRRLGYLLVHQKKWSEAVQSLQHAIRGYPTCADLWEALGLAYQRLGRFTAALKSYGRSIELESAKVFSLVESGNVFLMLGSFKKGVEQFRQALDLSPKCVSAFYGLACGLLGMAKECICLGALQWSATLLEEASKVANASTLLAGNLSCIWKLHGDIQLTYAKCYPWMEESQGSDYNAEAFSASILSWKNTCYLAAISARRSYQRSLLLAPWQANMYTDIAITSDLIYTLNKSSGSDLNVRQPSEKMAMGALLLERANHEFWVALGCLSDYNALKQHALIRALQLDVSLAVAWAYLGKLFRKEGEKLLARQAFDSARSVDPSLALPWAGMSADFQSSDPAPDEAFESCLRAAQTFPLAEFQIGLAKLALVSGHLYSSQVFGAIRQAVQHAPQYPECHNLNGLVCEAHADYQSAAACFRLARCALTKFSDIIPKSHSKDISINLARSLCRAGNAADALQECENLKKEGLLGVDGLQIYALSLWQLGKNDLVLSAARNLAATVSTMDHMSAAAAAAVCLICRLLFRISGMDSAINSILKMPKGLFQSSKISFIVSSIHALDRSNRLESVVSSSRKSLRSQEEICGMHFLIAIGKLIKHGSEYCLQFQNGIAHLRKALHMYPNSVSLRSLLGYLLLSNEGWYDSHVATRCCSAKVSCYQKEEGLKSAYEILGAGAVACYAISTINPKFSFPTCTYQCLNGQGAIQQLQKCLRQEPWNQTARYLLILNLLQKAREEKFPRNLCNMLERLILVALSQEAYSKSDMSHQYKKFQLLLSAAEICLQGGNQIGCIDHANNASLIVLPDGYLFFSHLLLCRAYASSGDIMNLEKEYMRCLGLKTDCHIGWICLKFIASRFRIQNDSDILQSNLKKCLLENSGKMWMAVYNLVLGLVSVWNMDFLSAEQFLLQACSLASAESCLQLCHGVISMELSRQLSDPHYISLAIRSLNKAQAASPIPLPIVSILLAQAEGSLGSREKWEHNLRLEWFTWPPEMRPAELLFQMHFLAIQSKSDISSVEFCQSPQRWVLRAIHTNPSCMRYWKVAQKILE